MKMDGAESDGGFDRCFSPGRFLLLLGLLIFISYPGIVLGTHAFFYRDAGLFSYPVAYYFRDCFWQGQWPLWNPYNNCGIPFVAQWNTLALYPPSLFYLALPMPWSLNYYLLGHILLAGLGMYQLGRHWWGTRLAGGVAGVAFAWNGLMLNCLMWSGVIAALAWMPWVVLYCDRARKEGGRTLAVAALPGACQMLSGSPEVILFTWLIAAAGLIFDVWQKKQRFGAGFPRLLFLVALVSALSAAQLLPWFDLLGHGDRSSSFGGNDWPLPPWGLANFLVPLFHAAGSLSGVYMQAEQQWTSSYYVGILPLLLAIVGLWRGRRERTMLLALLAVAAVLLAFGDAGMALPALRRVVPLLGFTRYPIKFIVITIFCLALLAGAGAAWLQTQAWESARRTLPAAGAAPGLGVGLILAAAYWFPFPSDSWSAVWPNALGRLLVLGAGLGLLVLTFKKERPAARAFLWCGFLILTGIDVCTHAPRQNPTVIARAYGAVAPQMTAAPRLGESRAMLSAGAERAMGLLVNPDPLQFYLGQRAELSGDCNLLERIPKVGGFFGLHLAWQQKAAGLLAGGRPLPRLAEFLGVSQIAPPTRLFVWDAQTNYMPLASIGQKPVMADDSAALAALGSADFAPRQIVYLTLEARGKVTAAADPSARVVSSHVTSSECIFETSASARAMLVIAQSYYHCWEASVDGRPAALWRANYAFQAVEVPAGRHEVRLVYADRPFWIGLGITLGALVFCVGGTCWEAGTWERDVTHISEKKTN